jgi:phosphate:Na+ symporter
MQWFGGDPGVPVLVNGRETFPLVPVAVGLYSIFFNVFNTLLLMPFTGVFERVLLRVGHTSADDTEDYSAPKYLTADLFGDLSRAVPALQQEIDRYLQASALFLDTARGVAGAPKDLEEHHQAIDMLSRDIRGFAARLFTTGMPYHQADLVASLIEEADFAASLGETLHQIGRRVQRQDFAPEARALVDAALAEVSTAMQTVLPAAAARPMAADATAGEAQGLLDLRSRCLRLGDAVKPAERGAILALLGSAERTRLLIERLDSERRSVPRDQAAIVAAPPEPPFAGMAAMPAE